MPNTYASKLFTSTILLFHIHGLQAQNLEKIGPDKFTGKLEYKTSVLNIGFMPDGKNTLMFHLKRSIDPEQKSDICFLIFYFHALSDLSLSTGGKAYMLFADGNKMESTYISSYDSYQKNDLAFFVWPLSEYDIARVLNLELTDVRIETSAGNYDYEIKGKYPDIFKSAFRKISETYTTEK